MASTWCVAAAQPLSSIFKLPAELRIIIYEYLDFPPVDNQQCHGLILSCRTAKQECEKIAIKNFKAWITTYKQNIPSQCSFDVRFLLPQLPPMVSSSRWNIIRELTLVLRADLLFIPSFPSSPFFEDFRYLNPILGLCLDKLNLHFRDPREFTSSKWYLEKIFRRLQFIIEGGLMYGHDPVPQARDKQLRKFSGMWDHWKPEPSFLKKLVISWDLTEHGVPSEEYVSLRGVCKQHPTEACYGRRKYSVIDESGLIGEYMLESSCRFRPSKNEQHRLFPPLEHKAVCLRCTTIRDYRRHMRGLPARNDKRWL